MNAKTIGPVMVAVLFTIAGCKNQNEQAATSSAPTVVQAASVSSPPKIITKNHEFWKLLRPPQGDALLEISADYQQKRKEIDAKVASLQDPDLKKRMYEEEWAKVDKSVYISNEEQALQGAFPEQMQNFLQHHGQDWFELGHVDFSGTDRLDIKPVEASLVDFPTSSSIRMDVYAIDSIYSKFHEVAKDQINQMADAWAQAQSCTGKLRNVCRNLGGTPAECASPATLQEIEDRLGAGLSLECNDHPSLEEGRKLAEKQLRADRIILVGQGDPTSHRIDQCMMVDYDTETPLLTIDPKVLTAMQPTWKYEPPQAAPANLTVATFANMTYRLVEGRSVTTVKLVGSKGQEEGGQFWLDKDHVAFGDLDGDGVDDGVAVLVFSGGGSGVFSSLVAVTRRNGRLQTPAVKSLGDRIKINELNIRDQIVTVDMITHGPNDPLCCPTERQLLKLRLQGNSFVPATDVADVPLQHGSMGDASGESETPIRAAVDAWASAFRSKDVKKMSDCYAPLVEKYFLRSNITRDQLQSYEESAFARTVSIRKYDISDVHITLLPPDQGATNPVVYRRAEATFDKQWDTTDSNGKTFSGEEIEQLTFTSSPEGWKIVREEEEKIIRVSRK